MARACLDARVPEIRVGVPQDLTKGLIGLDLGLWV